MSAVRTAPQARWSIDQLMFHATAVLLLTAAVVFAARVFPDNFFVFRAQWLLHPPEQEHLLIARNFAKTGSISIDGSTLGPGFGSEHHAFIDGRFYPRSVVLPYLIYAIPFLISDTAWLWVTPLFGCLAVLGTAALIKRLTGSWLAGGAGAALVATTSPFLLSASGLAIENTIALSFIIWGCVFLEKHLFRPSLPTGVASGLLFGAIPLLRIDYAPVSACAIVPLTASAFTWFGARRIVSLRDIAETIPIVLIGAGACAVLLVNWRFYGQPFSSGYGSEAWQGSAGDVARNLLGFYPRHFVMLIWSYMFKMGLPATLLGCVGVVSAVVLRRRMAVSELMLGALSLFLLFFHLSKAGATGNGDALLNLSPPRYLLPVYATGIIIGITSLARLTPAGHSSPLTIAALVGLTAIGSSFGLREAYGNPGGLPVIDPYIGRLKSVQDFAYQRPDALFVGDLNTKAIITTERILIPRLMRDSSTLPAVIRAEMDKGHAAFIVDDEQLLAGSPLNSGYLESLRQAGFAVCPVAVGVQTFQEIVDVSKSYEVARVVLDSGSGLDRQTPALAAGKTYYLLAEGSFQYKYAGNRTDAQQLLINGERPFTNQKPDSRYCAVFVGDGKPVTTSIADSTYSDNQGTITLTIVARGPVNGN